MSLRVWSTLSWYWYMFGVCYSRQSSYFRQSSIQAVHRLKVSL